MAWCWDLATKAPGLFVFSFGVCMYVHVYIYTYMYAYIYIHICIYITHLPIWAHPLDLPCGFVGPFNTLLVSRSDHFWSDYEPLQNVHNSCPFHNDRQHASGIQTSSLPPFSLCRRQRSCMRLNRSSPSPNPNRRLNRSSPSPHHGDDHVHPPCCGDTHHSPSHPFPRSPLPLPPPLCRSLDSSGS